MLRLKVFEEFNSTIKKEVYHGTPDGRFSEIKNSLLGQHSDSLTGGNRGVVWFTDNIAVAKTYADTKRAYDYQNAVPRIFKRTIQLHNPLIVDARGQLWRKIDLEIDGEKIKGTRELVEYAKKAGYDGVVVKNVYDCYNHFDGQNLNKKYLSTTYGVFNDNQIYE
jgi:hypothetical protein